MRNPHPTSYPLHLMYFFFLLTILILGTAGYASFRGAPWVPTRKKDRAHIRDVLARAAINPKHIIDLGCGTGQLLFELQKKFPDITCTGYDLSLGPLIAGWIQKLFTSKTSQNVSLQWKNIFSADISNADTLFVFMMPELHTRIAKELLHHAKPHALIIFEAWPPEGFNAHAVSQQKGCLPLHIYYGKQFSHTALY